MGKLSSPSIELPGDRKMPRSVPWCLVRCVALSRVSPPRVERMLDPMKESRTERMAG